MVLRCIQLAKWVGSNTPADFFNILKIKEKPVFGYEVKIVWQYYNTLTRNINT